MEGYSFHKGDPQSESEFLFNQSGHRELQAAEGWVTYFIKHPSGKVTGRVHFHLDEGAAKSPLRAPFGSVEFNSLPPRLLFEFLCFVEGELKGEGVAHVTIKDTPAIFRPEQSSMLHVLLLNLGYRPAVAELSSIILTDHPDGHSKFLPREQRKLRQGKTSGLLFSTIPRVRWREVYHFIANCRAGKGYELSMTEHDLERTIDKFPDRFRFFAALQDTAMAAACISVMVRKDILYTFYFDHNQALDAVSPAATLIEGIYLDSLNQGVRMIDLGTSMLNGLPNFGLLDFKLNLGAVPSPKITFEKDLK